MKAIKTLITFLVLICATQAYSQNTTQKYNSYLDRTEFYDSYGNMVGYAKENSYLIELNTLTPMEIWSNMKRIMNT